MARNDVLAPEAPSAVAFEADRFEWAAPNRLEVSGRWFGLRGHRFMRPALMVRTGEDRRRLLALLEHKPWAADEGEPWVAAFAWEGEPVDLDAAELSVAPSLAVELPPLHAPGARGRSTRSGSRPAHASRAAAPRVTAHAERRAEALERELGEARRDLERVRGERDRAARAHREDTAALRARAAEATAAAQAAVAERDEARAGHDALERELTAARARIVELQRAAEARDAAPPAPLVVDDRAAAEADAARHERDEALAARDAVKRAARREREALERRIEAAEGERDATRRERNEWMSRADAAFAARQAATAERDAAAAERDAAMRERDAARAQAAGAAPAPVRGPVDGASGEPAPAAFDPAPAGHRAPRGPAPRAAARARRANGDAAVGWLPRLLALAALLAVALVVATLLGLL